MDSDSAGIVAHKGHLLFARQGTLLAQQLDGVRARTLKIVSENGEHQAVDLGHHGRMTHTEPALTLFVEHVPSPLGTLLLLTDADDRVRVLEFDDHEFRFERSLRLHYGRDKTRLVDRPAPSSARFALERYFAGDLTAIDSLEVATAGTPFQRTVWAALRTIPAGETRSYSELADAIGRPRAVRAVGLANGSNPIGIVVPCHRVIGANASLTGYGGGLHRKQWLLEHEGALVSRPVGPASG